MLFCASKVRNFNLKFFFKKKKRVVKNFTEDLFLETVEGLINYRFTVLFQFYSAVFHSIQTLYHAFVFGAEQRTKINSQTSHL